MRISFHVTFFSACLLIALQSSGNADVTERAVLQNKQIAASSGEYIKLQGSQIKQLFSDLDHAGYPQDLGGYGGGSWEMSFQANGTWDAWGAGRKFETFGKWTVEADQLCLTVDGGDIAEAGSPYEGCVTVLVDFANATIAVMIPELVKDRLIVKEEAFGDVAELKAPDRVASSQRSEPQKPPPGKEDQVYTEQQRDLERQRLLLERQRLESEAELQKMRLALEKQRLEQEKQALLLRQQRPAVDYTSPVIETTEKVTTTESTVRIAGIVRDNGRLARVEVGGRRTAVDADTGRFSAEVPLKLGQNKVVISATDANGNKAERAVLVTRKRDIPDIEFGTYHAVVIGINDYESLPKLKTAITDARAVAETLEKDYGFTVRLLENPKRDDIVDTFDELRETLAETDNLLIYYAGHGWLDKQSGRGYWLPLDARSDRRSRWVSNTDLTDALQALLAKHVMVVADSCYSGTLTRSVKVPERNKAYLERIAEKRARVVLSSGGLEPVADSGGGNHSVFAAQFLKALKKNEGVLDGTQMFEKVRSNVVLNADQTPEYSDIRKAGHEGGDFLFVRRE